MICPKKRYNHFTDKKGRESMDWKSEDGQKVLAAKYTLRTNGSRPVEKTNEYLNELIFGDAYSKERILREWVGGKWWYFLERDRLKRKGVESVRIVSKGRKPIDEETAARIRFMRLEGHTVREIASALKVGRGTVEKYMR